MAAAAGTSSEDLWRERFGITLLPVLLGTKFVYDFTIIVTEAADGTEQSHSPGR
jgi:hypothetical protein